VTNVDTFWGKYREHLPDPQTSNLAFGKAVHTALAENFSPNMKKL